MWELEKSLEKIPRVLLKQQQTRFLQQNHFLAGFFPANRLLKKNFTLGVTKI